METKNKLMRPDEGRAVCGVCAGLGERTGMDPLVFRLLFVLLSMALGLGIVLYFISALLIPSEKKMRSRQMTSGIVQDLPVEAAAAETAAEPEVLTAAFKDVSETEEAETLFEAGPKAAETEVLHEAAETEIQFEAGAAEADAAGTKTQSDAQPETEPELPAAQPETIIRAFKAAEPEIRSSAVLKAQPLEQSPEQPNAENAEKASEKGKLKLLISLRTVGFLCIYAGVVILLDVLGVAKADVVVGISAIALGIFLCVAKK